jgi:hypothetical protein
MAYIRDEVEQEIHSYLALHFPPFFGVSGLGS